MSFRASRASDTERETELATTSYDPHERLRGRYRALQRTSGRLGLLCGDLLRERRVEIGVLERPPQVAVRHREARDLAMRAGKEVGRHRRSSWRRVRRRRRRRFGGVVELREMCLAFAFVARHDRVPQVRALHKSHTSK